MMQVQRARLNNVKFEAMEQPEALKLEVTHDIKPNAVVISSH
jgi:hypothetical protein